MRAEDAAAEALALILAALPGSTKPADQLLHEFFRAHPALGRRDRAQVGDWVFDVLRNLRRYRQMTTATQTSQSTAAAAAATREGATTLPAARELIAVARAAGSLPPGSLTDDLAGSPEPSDAIRYSLPDWLWERLRQAHGERAGAIAASLLKTAPIDLRVNLLRGKAAALRAKLAEHGIEAAPVDGVPTALRIEGRPRLEALALFERGWFEIQDAGSQRIADVCDARRGQLVIDFCAGAGGKTLALAARMRNAGKILAFDTGEERLSRLLPRAVRAGVDIVSTLRIAGLQDPRLARYHGRADVVLVDAPCSGTGTLSTKPGPQVAPDAGAAGGSRRGAAGDPGGGVDPGKTRGCAGVRHLQPAAGREPGAGGALHGSRHGQCTLPSDAR